MLIEVFLLPKTIDHFRNQKVYDFRSDSIEKLAENSGLNGPKFEKLRKAPYFAQNDLL